MHSKLITLVGLVGIGLSPVSSVVRATGFQPVTSDTQQLVDGNRAFALDLLHALRDTEGNLVFSPYSISTALAMTYAGARGTCAEEMAQTLHFALPSERLHPAFAELLERDNAAATRQAMSLAVANALWGQKGLGFLVEFLELARQHYGAGLRELDFVGATEPARLEINAWIEERTQGRIVDLLQPGDIDAMTVLVLTNAIYFKGAWRSAFDPKLTAPAPFQLGGGKTVEVPTMTQSGTFRLARVSGAQVLALPYRGEELSMVIVVPKAVDGLAELEKSITAADLEQWIDGAASEEVTVRMPRFRVSGRIELKDVLKGLGMKSAFGPGADFSGMTAAERLFIAKVIHQAFVEVNEEGTEAAAATAVVMKRTSMPAVVQIDRPFLFIIRNDVTRSWLFVGRVCHPGT